MYNYHTETIVTDLPENQVFVFGSNLAGSHRGGAAKIAQDYFGALHGVGRGWSGQSFAIPTLNEHFQPMPLSQIAHYLDDFKIYTQNHPTQIYFITAIGCGGAGYQAKNIAPLFKGISNNVILPIGFKAFLEDNTEAHSPKLRHEVLQFFCRDELIFADATEQNAQLKHNAVLIPEEKHFIQKALAKNSYTDHNICVIAEAIVDLNDCFTLQSNSEGSMIFASKILNLLELYKTDITTFKQIWQA